MTIPVHKDIHFSRIHWPGAEKHGITRPVQVINRFLDRIGASLWLTPRHDMREDMVSMEQVVNFQHLLARVFEAQVPGDVVELGCYTGSTSAIIGNILKASDSTKAFHVYDSFENNLSRSRIDVLSTFVANMKAEKLELPFIHKGDLYQTVPAELPERIAFAHFDLGVGGSPEQHKQCLLHCLNEVYPRMPHGAIGVLMDYHIPGITINGADVNPGVRQACDEFFADKPEEMYTLYGGPCSHGYFKKI